MDHNFIMAAKRTRPYILLIAAAVTGIFFLTPGGRSLDRFTYDSWFGLRGHQQLSDDIIFVAIDEISFQETGLRWPWPRDLHAKALQNIYAAGAKVVAIDILFPEPSDQQADQIFAQTLGNSGTTILAADVNTSEDNRFVVENNIRPLDIFITPHSRIGHVRTPTDPDGFVRRSDLELRELRSLGFEAARAFTDDACCELLPDAELPLIDYSGGPETVRTISYYQVLEPDQYLPPDLLKDKLVVLGVNTTSSAMPEERRPDHFPTPFTRWGEGYSPGSMVHANVAAALLGRGFIREIPLMLVWLAGFLIALIYGAVTMRAEFKTSAIVAAVTGFILLIVSYQLFIAQIYVSPAALAVPLLAVYVFSPYYRYLAEQKQRAYIRKAFSSYVNPEIVRQLEENPEGVRLGGKQVDATALFLDIAGFTDLSERHDPETIITFINELFSSLIDIAMEEGGTVERFLGDAIMVIWGAPTEQHDHADRACRTAIKMAREIKRISESEAETLGTRVGVRIGINSGSMTAGNIGADKRFNYTVLGDCVNLAARLENLNKVYGTTIMIGDATAQMLKSKFELRRLDTVTVKGRKTPEEIYELLSEANQLSPDMQQLTKAYALGLEFYRERNWQTAAGYFSDGLKLQTDGPCKTMLERCESFQSEEPPSGWDGVFDITSK
ncbi:MAG: CHASE2 domain-containing protein [Gammaproteobacteria bacterium]